MSGRAWLTTAVGFAAAAVIVAGRRALVREADTGVGSNLGLPAISRSEAVGAAFGPAHRLITGMRLADVGAVAALEESLFGAEAWSAELLAAEVAGDPARRYYLVAEDNGVIIGYGGLLAQRGGQADVLTLAVAANRQGEGIGGALLDGLLSEAARRGCREVFLETRVGNERAQRLYRRRGFIGIGIRRAYYQPGGADALVMRLVTAPPPATGNREPGWPARGGGGDGAAAVPHRDLMTLLPWRLPPGTEGIWR
jgi:[ribosomal protein S18]-alanine N-acetyltransferase